MSTDALYLLYDRLVTRWLSIRHRRCKLVSEDGVTVWLGYLMALATIVYFALMGGVVSFYLVKWIEYLINLFGGGT